MNENESVNPIRGTVLKEIPNDPFGFGVQRFLLKWQEDAVSALGTHSMGDRDSYPGQYLARMVSGGFISKDELESVMFSWLNERHYCENGFSGVYHLEDIILAADHLDLQVVLVWLGEHYDELHEVMSSYRGLSSRGLVMAVAKINNREIRESLQGRLEDSLREDWTNISLFRAVYLDERRASSGARREAFLQNVCKRIRRLHSAVWPYGSAKEGLITSLRIMLWYHFGYNPGKEGNHDEETGRAEKWLRAQNAYVPFPV